MEFYKIFFVQRRKDHSRQRRLELSSSSLVQQIFVLKLESCRKSHRFLNVFCLPKF